MIDVIIPCIVVVRRTFPKRRASVIHSYVAFVSLLKFVEVALGVTGGNCRLFVLFVEA